jgi:hypothetical protein
MAQVKPEDRKRETYLVFPESKMQVYFTEPLSPRKKRELRILTRLAKSVEPGVGYLVVRTDSPWFQRVLAIIEENEGHSQDWVPDPPKEAPKTETSQVNYTVPSEPPQGTQYDDQE